jgi:DNA-binding XRE family transcriptional regulator
MPEFVITPPQRELIVALIPELPVYRKRMRMSQADFGRAIGKSRQKISEIERGVAPLGWDTYLAIILLLSAHGVLEPYGRDAAMFAGIEKIIGGRFRFC